MNQYRKTTRDQYIKRENYDGDDDDDDGDGDGDGDDDVDDADDDADGDDDDGQTHCYAVTGEEDWHSICPTPAPVHDDDCDGNDQDDNDYDDIFLKK